MMGAAGDLPSDPDRNLALELVRVTEAAAMSAVQYMGMGNKELVDQAAVDAMRQCSRASAMDGIVVIGEGEKDEAPMLYNGERVGDARGPPVTSPSTRSTGRRCSRRGCNGAIAVIALSERGTMNDPGQRGAST